MRGLYCLPYTKYKNITITVLLSTFDFVPNIKQNKFKTKCRFPLQEQGWRHFAEPNSLALRQDKIKSG